MTFRFARGLFHRPRHYKGEPARTIVYRLHQTCLALPIRQAVLKADGERYLEHINVYGELVWRLHY